MTDFIAGGVTGIVLYSITAYFLFKKEERRVRRMIKQRRDGDEWKWG